MTFAQQWLIWTRLNKDYPAIAYSNALRKVHFTIGTNFSNTLYLQIICVQFEIYKLTVTRRMHAF